ncbi:hemerythrin family protein [Magnetovibrio sp. PR-2]|uniref:bacteriohemerythrin n=1 Tax=Magnetovibrio sp. PR-2 TaxID=3120356 RepID=UPI002FCE2559
MTIQTLEWSDKFSVDIVSIDEQHKELIDLSQELLNVLSTDDVPLSEKQTAFKALVDHALDHFAYEERVMHNIGYPDLDAHILEHNDLRKEIDAIASDVLDGKGIEDWKGLVSMVQVWVLRHIMHTDMGIRDFIRREDD